MSASRCHACRRHVERDRLRLTLTTVPVRRRRMAAGHGMGEHPGYFTQVERERVWLCGSCRRAMKGVA